MRHEAFGRLRGAESPLISGGGREMRAFLALPVPLQALDALAEAQERMRAVVLARSPAVRWTQSVQWHLTLKFLGEVSAEQAAALAERIDRRLQDRERVSTHWTKVKSFGPRRRARVIVAEVHACDSLRRLAQEMEEEAFALGIPREERPFRPHITLARIKRPCDASAWLDAARLEPAELRFDQLVLYRSQLTASGGVYSMLRNFPLRPPEPERA